MYTVSNDDIKGFPSRASLKTDELDYKKPIAFAPSDITETLFDEYRIIMYGTLENNEKGKVSIIGIFPSFDIRIKDNSVDDIKKLINSVLTPIRMEDIEAWPMDMYRVNKSKYIRLYFTKLMDMRSQLFYIRKNYAWLETASEFWPRYYRKVSALRGLNLTGWLRINEYSARYRGDGLHHIITNINYIESVTTDKIPAVLHCSWDIETSMLKNTGDPPEGSIESHPVCMICCVYCWGGTTKASRTVAIVNYNQKKTPDMDIVVCKTQAEMIKAFAIVQRYIMPDIEKGYCSSSYDWKFIVEKAILTDTFVFLYEKMRLDVLFNMPRRSGPPEVYLKWKYFEKKRIKISADHSVDCTYLKIPGIVHMDVCVCLEKIYPRAEVNRRVGLNYYLTTLGLPTKLDVTAQQMFIAFNNNDLETLEKVLRYCIVDAISCHRISEKLNIDNEYQEYAIISNSSVGDVYSYADGSRIQTMIFAEAARRGYLCYMKRETESFPSIAGGFVKQPETGLETGRPVTSLDARSLYPSIILYMNISPETQIIDEKYSGDVRSFTYEKGCVTNFRNHHNDESKMGIVPKIILMLLTRRRAVKKEMNGHNAIKEICEKLDKLTKENLIKYGLKVADDLSDLKKIASTMSKRAFEFKAAICVNQLRTIDKIKKHDDLNGLYQDSVFLYNRLNSRQLTLKKTCNSIYGQMATKDSPFCDRGMGSTVTGTGQKILKHSIEYVISKHQMEVIYGDTDSMYIKCPWSVFSEEKRRYENKLCDKKEYYTKLVELSMDYMDIICSDLNKECVRFTGTPYIVFAYEEVNFPFVSLAKKKYYSVPHYNLANFEPKELFVRGIDIVKTGLSKFVKKIVKELMWASVSIYNEKGLMELAKDHIKKAIYDTWELSDFIQYGKYKGNKNIPMRTFFERLKLKRQLELSENDALVKRGLDPKEMKYIVPELGEKFEYVICKAAETHDLAGNRIDTKLGGRMCLVKNAKIEDIDLEYYLMHKLAGILGRFICYDKSFVTEKITEETSNSIMKIIDSTQQKKAMRFIRQQVKEIMYAGIVKQPPGYETRLRKKNYQTIFGMLSAELGRYHIYFQPSSVCFTVAILEESPKFSDWVWKKTEECAATVIDWCRSDYWKAINETYATIFSKMTEQSILYRIKYELGLRTSSRELTDSVRKCLSRRYDLLTMCLRINCIWSELSAKMYSGEQCDNIPIDAKTIREFDHDFNQVVQIHIRKSFDTIKNTVLNEVINKYLGLKTSK